MGKLSLAALLLAGFVQAGTVTFESTPLATDVNNFTSDPFTSGIATIHTQFGFTSSGDLFTFGELDATFTSPVTDAGFIEVGPGLGSLVFTGATFDNGDSTPGSGSVTPGTLFAFNDTTPFTGVTFNFTFSGSPAISDFEFTQASGAPEPSTAMLIAPALLLLALGVSARKRLAAVRVR